MTKAQRYFNLLINYKESFAPKQNIFILSHMRSTSSLLSHILSSHKQICGHRELHSSYTKQYHLIKTRAALYSEKESFENSTYLADKLLHNRLVISEKIFKTKPKYIFLLRDPERTMSSMIKMHLRDHNLEEDIYKLENYYLSRIDNMIENWNNLKGDKIYISSEELVEKTQEQLRSLSNFLCLSEPLTEHYKIYNDTGKGGVGDPSSNIKSGKILKSTPMDKKGKELSEKLNMEKICEKYQQAIKEFI
ncbi:sulfotransferase [Vibrio salinus]|uniref:sulfotransferase n=1 Tax=Vibrio salinus TaxID=2899784 RepID=UPI001E4E155F|nr:sulfotransferase [Vibrio salinus]MCE0493271.1 sulfotransferase [Vibrio salinus]